MIQSMARYHVNTIDCRRGFEIFDLKVHWVDLGMSMSRHEEEELF
jgi:hypothetical protein